MSEKHERQLGRVTLRRTAKDAERFARIVHEGQTDKAGKPYVEHLGRVAVRAIAHWMDLGEGTDDQDLDTLGQIAWLHDVVEDTPYDADHLRREGFCDDVVKPIERWLTKHRGITYEAYLAGIVKHAPLSALLVKLADMEDNSNPERLAQLPADTCERLRAKYAEPLKMLRAAVEEKAGAHHG